MEEKVKIQISPGAALAICGFLMEWEPDMNNNHQFTYLKECIEEFKQEVFKMPKHLFEDGLATQQMKSLIGDAPPMRGNLRIRDE